MNRDRPIAVRPGFALYDYSAVDSTYESDKFPRSVHYILYDVSDASITHMCDSDL